MRIAALIFGLLAGGLGAAVILYGNLQGGLAVAPLLGTAGTLAGRFGLYGIIGIGLLGALLALFWPKIGGIFMLLGAAAWVAAAFLAGHGAIYFAALPFTFVAAGALVALFAGPRDSGGRDVAVANGGGRRQWEDDDEDEGPAYAPAPRGLRGRSEPDFSPSPRRVVQPPGRPYAPPPVEDDEDEEDYTPAEDYVDAEEAVDEEDGDEGEDYYDAEEEQPSDEGLVEDDDQRDTQSGDEPAAYPPRGGRQDQWSLPEQPARRPRERNIPERTPAAPTRRQAAQRPTSRRGQREESYDIAEEDFAPERRDFQPRPRNAYREFEPFEPNERRPRRGPLAGFLRLLMMLIAVLVVAGVGLWVYLDYQKGTESVLFGTHGPLANAFKPASTAKPVATIAPATPSPAVTAAPAAIASPAITPPTTSTTATPAATVADTTTAVPAAQPAATTAAVPAQPDVTPPAIAASAPTPTPAASSAVAYTDPFGYCRAVETADAPDDAYTGPAVPGVVAAALGVTGATDQVHWRCANQDVLACNSNHGAACNLTPTVDMMLSYCAQHPDAQGIPAPNGSWSCNGKRPVIPRDQKWPVDARGFYPGAWKVVPHPASG